MHSKLLCNANIYNKEPNKETNFERPKVIGYINLENFKFANCKYIKNKEVNWDLNLHLDKAKHKIEGVDVKLNNLVQFLLQNEIRLNLPLPTTLENANFRCNRGLLTCIACTPYEYQEPWKIVAVLFKGHIYLCARYTEKKINEIKNMTDKEKRSTAWGFKFEQYILSDKPNEEPNPDVPRDENEDFSLVFTTHFNRHTIVYTAEMDGIQCDENISTPPTDASPDTVTEYLSNKTFIELKTHRHIEFPKQEKSFRHYKTKRWWCQSYFVGVDMILCGLRNDDGIVQELKTYPVKDLPKMSRGFWDPNVCLNFLDAFLDYVKRCLATEIKYKHGDRALDNIQTLPLTSILFERKPRRPVHVVQNYVYEDDPILPQRFVENYCKTRSLDQES